MQGDASKGGGREESSRSMSGGEVYKQVQELGQSESIRKSSYNSLYETI